MVDGGGHRHGRHGKFLSSNLRFANFKRTALHPFLPSDEVLVAVEHLGGALLDLLGDPVAQLVVPGLSAVAHAHLKEGLRGLIESNQVNRIRVDSPSHSLQPA